MLDLDTVPGNAQDALPLIIQAIRELQEAHSLQVVPQEDPPVVKEPVEQNLD